jgi:aromatic-L-amino-acid decarboxylase
LEEAKLEQLNTQIIDPKNDTGKAFLSHTKLHGKYTIRVAIGNIRTTEKHIANLWNLIKTEAIKVK